MIRLVRRIAPLAVALFAAPLGGCSEARADASAVLADVFRMGSGQSPFYGRKDGIGVDVDNYGPGLVVNGEVDQMFNSSLYVGFHEEFLGDFIIPPEGTADGAQGPWVSTNTGTSQGIAAKADFDNGAVELLISNTSEVGDATLFWDDELNIDSDTEPFCIFRTQIQTDLAAADSVSWGLIGPQNDIISSTANNAYFSVSGADYNLDVSTDDATTDDANNDTTVDMAADTYIETMVSLNSMHGRTATDPDGASPTDVHFFYRTSTGAAWTQVLASTTFSIGADIALQPFVQAEKTTGTTVPDVLVDYIRCYWQRE